MTQIIEHELKCPDCGGEMWLKPKGGRNSRPRYLCERYPLCKGSHSAHKSGKPMGTPGDFETRGARIEAHRALKKVERIFGNKARAYKWLATVLHLDRDQCHIGLFDIAECKRVIGAVNSYTRGNK